MISILFDNPKYDANVEIIARTCEFFGHPFYVRNLQKIKSLKKSAGVLKHRSLKELDISKWQGRIIVTDSCFAHEPKKFEFKDGDLIVFGNESSGVSVDLIDISSARIGIKSKGIVPNLNVSASCAAILSIIDFKANGR